MIGNARFDLHGDEEEPNAQAATEMGELNLGAEDTMPEPNEFLSFSRELETNKQNSGAGVNLMGLTSASVIHHHADRKTQSIDIQINRTNTALLQKYAET